MLCSQMPAGTNGQQTLLQLQPAEIKGSERGRPANLTPELGKIDQRPQPATRRQVSKCSHQRLVTKWCVCSVAQSCLTLCDPMDCSPPGSSVHGDSPGKNTGVGWHALLQGIFPTQGWNLSLLCLLHWQAGSSPLGYLGRLCLNKTILQQKTQFWTLLLQVIFPDS